MIQIKISNKKFYDILLQLERVGEERRRGVGLQERLRLEATRARG